VAPRQHTRVCRNHCPLSRRAVIVAVLSNVDGTPVRAIANELAAIAFGEKYELPWELKEAPIDPATFDRGLGNTTKTGNRTIRSSFRAMAKSY
jgi:hypothetical protein